MDGEYGPEGMGAALPSGLIPFRMTESQPLKLEKRQVASLTSQEVYS